MNQQVVLAIIFLIAAFALLSQSLKSVFFGGDYIKVDQSFSISSSSRLAASAGGGERDPGDREAL